MMCKIVQVLLSSTSDLLSGEDQERPLESAILFKPVRERKRSPPSHWNSKRPFFNTSHLMEQYGFRLQSNSCALVVTDKDFGSHPTLAELISSKSSFCIYALFVNGLADGSLKGVVSGHSDLLKAAKATFRPCCDRPGW